MLAALTILTLYFAVSAVCQSDYGESGDFVIGLVLPIHETNASLALSYDIRNACGELNGGHALAVSQFRRMIAAVNNDRENSLPMGLKLGFSVIDSCDLPNVAIVRAENWTAAKKNAISSLMSSGITLAIGAYGSRVTGPLATYLQLYQIPLLDFGSTSSDLSDRRRYPLYLRTVPSDTFQAKAFADISKAMGFQCVHLVYSQGMYGESGAEDVRKHLSERSICIASSHEARNLVGHYSQQQDFDKIVAHLLATPQASAVICFCEDTTIIGLLTSLQLAYDQQSSSNRKHLTILASDFWGTSLDVFGLEDVAEGAITLSLGENDRNAHVDNSWFNEQLHSITNQDPWFKEYIEKRFHCAVESSETTIQCDVSSTTLSPGELSILPRVSEWHHFELSFQVAVEGLRNMINAHCNNEGSRMSREACSAYVNSNTVRLYDYLRQVKLPTFQFNDNGDARPVYQINNYRRLGFGSFYMNRYEYSTIGRWSLSGGGLETLEPEFSRAKVRLIKGKNETISSICECVQVGSEKTTEMPTRSQGRNSATIIKPRSFSVSLTVLIRLAFFSRI